VYCQEVGAMRAERQMLCNQQQPIKSFTSKK
jgi:hypothetical protein